MVTLHFSYSSAKEPDTSSVTLPLDLIAQLGGHLHLFIVDHNYHIESTPGRLVERTQRSERDHDVSQRMEPHHAKGTIARVFQQEQEADDTDDADGARVRDDERRISGPSEYSREGEAEELEEHDEHDEPRPEMTDGSSAEESDVDSEYGLTALLR